ncbi:TIM barrel protein [Saccharomonospora sp. NPDC046836]|uniref:hydroxypyruvate isomerase family protein n=1 Tax=Saccharomonospora sp. NPDC046836 TaxID=3156921 RepID=UPI0033C1FB7A
MTLQYRGLPLSANVSILFAEMPYAQRFTAARAAGFTAVETWWPFGEPDPDEEKVDEFLALLDVNGVRLTGLNFWAGDMAAGDRGMVSHPDRHDELRANIARVAMIGERTGCAKFNLLHGAIPPQERSEDRHRAIVDVYREAVDAVSGAGKVLVEPLARELNGDYPLETAQDAASLVADIDRGSNAALLFDTFHLGHNEDDLIVLARQHGPVTGHVQIADDPGRAEPSSGALPLAECVDTLAAAGYDDWIGVEYRASTSHSEDSLGWVD